LTVRVPLLYAGFSKPRSSTRHAAPDFAAQEIKMKYVDFRLLREKVPMSAVIELLGYVPRSNKQGQLRGPCPVHQSKSPTSRVFSVNLARNAFRCFSCGAQGNQLDLWAQIHSLSTHAAAIDLAERIGVDVTT